MGGGKEGGTEGGREGGTQLGVKVHVHVWTAIGSILKQYYTSTLTESLQAGVKLRHLILQ